MSLGQKIKNILGFGGGKIRPPSVAYVINKAGCSQIQGLGVSNGVDLPSDSVVIQTGNYLVGGELYELSVPGVYRFYQLGNYAEQRFVPSVHLDEILACIGHLWGHGTNDDKLGKSAEQLIRETCKRKLFLSCGNTSRLALKVLEQCDVVARLVHGISKDRVNGWDDGHSLLEIRCGHRWFAYDPSFNCCFKQNGNRLDILELSRVIDGDSWSLERFSDIQSFGQWEVSGHDCSFWVAHRQQSPEAMRRWLGRVLQIPIIEGKEILVACGSLPEMSKDERPYKLMDEKAFAEEFYR